jgi:hypothetical protein
MNAFLGGVRLPRARFANGRLLTGLAACVVVAGCMTTKVDETRQAATAVQHGESIVLLRKPQIEGTGAEEAFSVACRSGSAGRSCIPRRPGRES